MLPLLSDHGAFLGQGLIKNFISIIIPLPTYGLIIVLQLNRA